MARSQLRSGRISRSGNGIVLGDTSPGAIGPADTSRLKFISRGNGDVGVFKTTIGNQLERGFAGN